MQLNSKLSKLELGESKVITAITLKDKKKLENFVMSLDDNEQSELLMMLVAEITGHKFRRTQG